MCVFDFKGQAGDFALTKGEMDQKKKIQGPESSSTYFPSALRSKSGWGLDSDVSWSPTSSSCESCGVETVAGVVADEDDADALAFLDLSRPSLSVITKRISNGSSWPEVGVLVLRPGFFLLDRPSGSCERSELENTISVRLDLANKEDKEGK